LPEEDTVEVCVLEVQALPDLLCVTDTERQAVLVPEADTDTVLVVV
jgi:hypothetical protein